MRVNITLSEDLAKRIDRAAKRSFQSRSAYIRSAVIDRMRYEGEIDVPNTISDEDFERAKRARALISVKRTLQENK